MTSETLQNDVDKMDTPLPGWIFVLMPIYISVVIGIFIFPFAWTLFWLEGWLFIITLSLNISISYYIINRKNPRLIRNRTKTKKVGITEETKKAAGSDKYLLPLVGIGFICALIFPSFDYRFQWTTIPFMVEILGLLLSNIGLVIMNVAQFQNAYASKILDINKGQKLIDTGLYGHVRHPLYSGGIFWVLFLPISLGSWISLIPAILAIIPLLIRIKYEEEMLIKGMEGYEDYRTRVKYKLIPLIY